MLIIEPTKDKNVITEIVTEKHLWAATNGTTDPRLFTPTIGFDYLLIKQEKHIIGMFKTRQITSLVFEVHSHILSAYWGSPITIQAHEALERWVLKNTSCKVLLGYVPTNCLHVLNYGSNLHYKTSGLIPCGIMSKGELVDLLILTKQLPHSSYVKISD